MRAGVSWWGNYLPPPRMGYRIIYWQV